MGCVGQSGLMIPAAASAVGGLAGWNYKTYAGCLLLGTLTSLILTPVIIRLAARLNAVDLPAHRKAHGRPVPLLGGLAIFVGMWVPLIALLVLDNAVTQQFWNRSAHIMTVLLGGVAMLILGAVDDLFGLRARHKLLIQTLVAAAVWLAGVRFSTLGLPFLGQVDTGILGPIISLLWIIGITNAFNLIDGIDGLATGVALFVSLTNGLIAVWNNSPVLAVLMFSIAGACLGFLRYNFNPARVFLGDTGSLFLGMTLGMSSVVTSSKSQVASSFLIALVVLGYPALDTLLAMTQRILRGKSPFIGDASHIHHLLVQKGLGHGQSALLLYAVCLLFCLTALAIALGKGTIVAVGLIVVGGLTAYGLWMLGYFRMFTRPSLPKDRRVYRAHHHFVEMIKAKMYLTTSTAELFAMLSEVPRELGFQRARISLKRRGGAPAFETEYGTPLGGGNPTGEVGSDTAMRHDRYEYPESGLEIDVHIRESSESPELVMERRTLLADAFEEANRRLLELEGSSGSSSAQPDTSAR